MKGRGLEGGNKAKKISVVEMRKIVGGACGKPRFGFFVKQKISQKPIIVRCGFARSLKKKEV